MIESGFSTSATSHAKAVGIWQFMPATGRRYGLRVNRYVDERRDPVRSTYAASLYLKDLFNVFNDWYLAMAAYNAGESRIMNAIMSGNTRDFWELVEKRKLPRETMNYTPKFIAATTISRNLSGYGITVNAKAELPELTRLVVPSPVRLKDVAKVSKISYADLKNYNPHLLRGMTPPNVKQYDIWVPKSENLNVAAINSALKSSVVRGLARRSYSRGSSSGQFVTHKVRRGDTLSGIARRYGVSLSKVRKLNRTRSKIVIGEYVKIKKNSSYRVASSKSRGKSISKKHYKVKRGDNLFNISKKFGVPIKTLKRLNRLRKNRIYVGQVLKINSSHSG